LLRADLRRFVASAKIKAATDLPGGFFCEKAQILLNFCFLKHHVFANDWVVFTHLNLVGQCPGVFARDVIKASVSTADELNLY
jgi:hypothetical protein